MRNALAIYLFHLPSGERTRYLELVYPEVATSGRKRHLEETVTPIPGFGDPRVQRALTQLRPSTHAFAGNILNAADVAACIGPERRDVFVRSVCGLAASVVAMANLTLFDEYRRVLRHISNEDARVVRALDVFNADPYKRAWTFPHRLSWPSYQCYSDEVCRQRTDEDSAMLDCTHYGSRPRVFRDVPEDLFDYHCIRSIGFGPREADAIVQQRGQARSAAIVLTKPAQSTPAVPKTVGASLAVERTRLQNEVRVLHDHRAVLQTQLAAKATVIETLEQERASDRARIAELEAAQNRTLQAFKELQRAEDRRLDAYMGVRRAAN